MGRYGVHQRRRQGIVRLEPEFSDPGSDRAHSSRVDSRLDHGGYEGGEFRRRPTGFPRQFGVDEIESIERMVLVLDPAVHVDAAFSASVTVNGLRGVDDVKLISILDNGDVCARHNGYCRKKSAFRLPAPRATTDMIVGALSLDGDLDGIARAFANERSAGEVFRCRFDPVIHGGMNRDSFRDGPSPLGLPLPNALGFECVISKSRCPELSGVSPF
jgi:hypothetical protein